MFPVYAQEDLPMMYLSLLLFFLFYNYKKKYKIHGKVLYRIYA